MYVKETQYLSEWLVRMIEKNIILNDEKLKLIKENFYQKKKKNN